MLYVTRGQPLTPGCCSSLEQMWNRRGTDVCSCEEPSVSMAPRNHVPCHCSECKGQLVPPSTRNTHHTRELRIASTAIPRAPLLRGTFSSAPRTKASTQRPRRPARTSNTAIGTSAAAGATCAMTAQNGVAAAASSERLANEEDYAMADPEPEPCGNLQLPAVEDKNSDSEVPDDQHLLPHIPNSIPNLPFTFTFPSPPRASAPIEPVVHRTSSTPAESTSAPSPSLHLATFNPLPARIRRLPVTMQAPALAAMRDAEERGREVMETSGGRDDEVDAAGPIGNDDWEEDDGDDLAADLSGQPADVVAVENQESCRDVNDPDPFYLPHVETSRSNDRTNTTAHSHPAVHLLYILVSWLHTHFHLPFAACQAMLVVVYHILFLASFPIPEKERYQTLPSVMNHLGVEPVFSALPVCPQCLDVYPATTSVSTSRCMRCQSPIFKITNSRSSRSRSAQEKFKPFLQFPTKSIEEQLREILAVDGMEDVMEKWRTKRRTPGILTDNFDGDICKTIKGTDGRLFFENPLPRDNNELRIGLTLGVDWFSYLRSQIAPSHTSGPISFNIINLDNHLRYRTSNIILGGVLPGPKEQNGDQVQRFLRIFVNELIRLYKEGFVIKTIKFPNGRRVRVILVCVICDKPAAHKMGGFGSHSHTFFCHRCWIQQSEKATAASFQKDAFPPRNHQQQSEYAYKYADLSNDTQRAAFVKEFATRWSELARLPYFDLCRMIVVDPMHNLLLGLVKTHFYNIWIQLKILRKTKELRRFHDILVKLQLPAYLGRLPAMMGEPAGGSLTADQWLVAATIVCPLIVPQIWEEYCPNAEDAEVVLARRIGNIQQEVEAKKAAAAASRKAAAAKKAVEQVRAAAAANSFRNSRPKRTRKPTERALYAAENLDVSSVQADAGEVEVPSDEEYDDDRPRKRMRTSGPGEDDENEEREPALPNLHPDDPAHFMKLSAALRIVLSHQVTLDDIDDADALLREYCMELMDLYGTSVIKPNHHFSTHVGTSMRDFGPLHCFWTFLFERINKVLKSYNSGNHSGGELETSFFREFHRTIQQSRVMAKARTEFGHGSPIQQSIEAMYRATADDRGTVQALSRDLDKANEDGGIRFQLGSSFRNIKMTPALYAVVLRYLQTRFPLLQLRSHLKTNGTPESIPLFPDAMSFDYAVISQRRYWASGRSTTLSNSIVAVRVDDTNIQEVAVGELLEILVVDQDDAGHHTFGHVRWLKPTTIAHNSFWSESNCSHLGLSFWVEGEYLGSNDERPSSLVEMTHIVNHVIRTSVEVNGQTYWVTILPQRSDRH